MRDVPVSVQPLMRFAEALGPEPVRELIGLAEQVRVALGGATVWNISSTAKGGGVAELLRPLIGYARSTGIDARWAVIEGPAEFFRLTKRLHHALHGSPGDGTPLDLRAHALYQEVLRNNVDWCAQLMNEGDVAVLHDPQTAGLAPVLRRMGLSVVWRCHIGSDNSNEEVDRGWSFLEPYLEPVQRFIFSRVSYIPRFIDRSRTAIVFPSLDPFSSKNQDLPKENVHAILVHAGLLEGPVDLGVRVFRRDDGTAGRVDRSAEVIRFGRPPRLDTPMIVQISRWDPLKDPLGVLRGFAGLIDPCAPHCAELVLAGPSVTSVADDPEAVGVFEQVVAAWRQLPALLKARIHLVNLPMADVEENAAIVNALQRHAAVIVQKSLREGFGLTVAEAMWKARPVIGSAVGGIREQIEDGISGLLLRDPRDLDGFGGLIRGVLESPRRAARLGANARQRVSKRFLGVGALTRYAQLVGELVGARMGSALPLQ